MIHHIDVSRVLRNVCDLYSNLVTRPTGAAVRAEIELQLADMRGRTLTVIDFTHVGLLDFSCADEVVAKLALRYCTRVPDEDHDAYFVLKGMHESHEEAVETVLARYGLALVMTGSGGHSEVVGVMNDSERRAWREVRDLGMASATVLSRSLAISLGDAERLLEALRERRLVVRVEEGYTSVGALL